MIIFPDSPLSRIMFVFDFALLATSLVWFLNGFKVEQVN
jgi:hypothetical protein